MSQTPIVNVHNQAFLEDPNAFLVADGVRAGHAIGTSGPEFFGYETARAIFRDKRLRPKNAEVYLDMGLPRSSVVHEFLVEGNFNMMPADVHDRMRRIMMKGFRPQRIREAAPVIRAIADELIDQLVEAQRRGESTDLVRDFSHHLSIRSISAFIGVPPQDVARFENATVELLLLGTVPFMPGVPRLEEALTEIYDYIQSLVRTRRAHRAQDFISDLVELQEGGDSLTEAQLIWGIVFLLLAGHDTTRSQIASAARCLIDSGTWEEVAADATLLPALVQESMRIYPAAYRFPRLVLEPLEIEGVAFEAGDLLAVNLTGAGRDPAAFPDPDEADLHRTGAAYDIGFGHGSHYCLGWALATAEIEQGIAALTERLTEVALTGQVEYVVGGVIAGPDRMGVSFALRDGATR